MIVNPRRYGLSLLLVFGSSGLLHAQPTAPSAERNAELRAMREADHPMAADGETLGGFVVDPASREESRTFYRTVFTASEGVDMEWTGSYDSGEKGDTSQAYKDAVRRRINYFRAMVGVPADITFNSTYSSKSQQAALMMSGNDQLSHFPPNSWAYWTADGREAAENSNLAIGSAGPDSVVGYIQDHGSGNTAVGHRRWLFYPQTKVMGTGDVPGIANVSNRRPANSIWVFDGNFGGTRPAVRDSFVAWPPPGYVPYGLIYPRWSVSYPGANFNGASVSMKRNGVDIAVAKEPLSSGVGETTLVWVYDGLDANVPQTHSRPGSDTTYSVVVDGVTINGQNQKWEYDVIVFDPDQAGGDFVATTVSGSSSPVVGADNTYSVATAGFATGVQWRSLQSGGVTTILEGAESGTSTVDIVSTAGYEVIVSNPRVSGSKAFNLRHSGGNQTEYVRLKDTFLARSDSQFSMQQRLAAVTDDQTAAVQLSFNGGGSWKTIWEHKAAAQNGTFSLETVSLGDYEGQTFELRLVFSIAFGSWFNGGQVGWYFDDVQLTNVETVAVGAASATIEGTEFPFNPPSAGDYGLQARPVFYNDYPLDWGSVLPVTAAAGANEAPQITVQPTGGTIDEGDSIDLTVVATGFPSPTYQWEKDGEPVSGATSATLSLTDAGADDDGSYTVVVSNSEGSVTSDAAVVTVNLLEGPMITTQPVGGTFVAGTTIQLTVAATGYPAPTYLWMKDGDPIQGATLNTLVLTDATEDDSGVYAVTVTNSVESVVSDDAVVEVAAVIAPAILVDPSDATAEAGGSATFAATVSGTPPFSFQWFKDGEAIDGSTAPVLRLSGLDSGDEGDYRVEVTNDAGTATSATARLTVNVSTFGGAYFGGPDGASGTLGLWVRGTNTAVFALYVQTDSRLILEDQVAVGGDGSFLFEGPEGTGTVSGQVSGDTVTGSVSGLSLGFTATRSDPNGSTPGFAGAYRLAVARESDSDAILIAGSDGNAVVFAPSLPGGYGEAIEGPLSPSGQFSESNLDGVQVNLQFTNGSVAGNFVSGSDTGYLGSYRMGVEPPHLLTNISMRGSVGTGGGIMIAGFVVGGTGQKPILVRAVGPTLAGFNVQDTISDPQLLVSVLSGPVVDGNDNWEQFPDQAGLDSVRARVGAFQLDAGANDSALVLPLDNGSFTAKVSGVGGVTGISLVEVYDADDLALGPVAAKLSNISMRGSVGTGSRIMIAGFVVDAGYDGNPGVPKQVLIRGVGPTLAGFNVQGTISDPLLRLFNADKELVGENDNWEAADNLDALKAAMTSVGAFDLDEGSADSALLIWLLPGSYTAQVRGVADVTGLALVEVYAVP
ncbi:MAG: immunoglobulin domain-containing protein [Opitutaceae bacterium]